VNSAPADFRDSHRRRLAVAIAQVQARAWDHAEIGRMLGVLQDLSDGEARRLLMDGRLARMDLTDLRRSIAS